MPHIDIPDAAVSAGARATAYLMRALRDNYRSADHYRQAFAYLLDETTGHRHGTGTVERSYAFEDRIEIKTGVNDKVPFRFASSSPNYAVASYSATLTAGVRSLASTASHIQSVMITAVGASAPIEVSYDDDPESKTRGLFLFKHTGSSDSPNQRILELLFGTGTGFATGVGPTIGYAKSDLKKALGYAGTSGFIDGLTEESFTLGEGGLLESADFVASAFTTAKFTNNIVPSAAIQASAVSGGSSGKIADDAVTSAKIGPAVTVASSLIGAGSSHTFDFALSSGGSGRKPQVALQNHGSPGALSDEVYITSISFSGGQWHVAVKNSTASNQDIAVAAY